MQLDLPYLSSVIETQFPDIAFAYLFGSAKEGSLKEGSDVDIALYYTGKEDLMRFYVEEELEKVFGGIVFDLVELQKANPVLAFEALSGSVLFIRPEAMDVYLYFYTLTCRLYRDRIYWMNKQLEYRGYEVQWSD